MHPRKLSNSSISNLNNLCAALRLNHAQLYAVLSLPPDERYKIPKPRPKASGELRVVYNPVYELRLVQRRINKYIFKNQAIVEYSPFVFGSLPNLKKVGGEVVVRDYIACAGQHKFAKSLLRLDIKDFFGNISRDLVYDVFRGFFKYPEDVSNVLSDLCTYQGFVPQGSLTASYIACLVFWDCEWRLVSELKSKGLIYTRFVDDITVSSSNHSYDFSMVERKVVDMLDSKCLPLNLEKKKVMRRGTESLVVHGLRVNCVKPTLPKDEVRKIKACLFNLERLAEDAGYRSEVKYRRDYNRCMGRISMLKRIGDLELHGRLLSRINDIQPLPSELDLKIVKKYSAYIDSNRDMVGRYWYKKRYFRLAHKLVFLSSHGRYKKTVAKVRAMLSEIKVGSYER